MPHQQTSNGQPTKPLMPVLSSRFRSRKSPITPKLAGLPQASPALSRLSPDRDAQPAIGTIAREVNSPLSANITPRSGNRRSRIGTNSPATPTGVTSAGAMRARAASGSKTGADVAMNSPGLRAGSPGLQPYIAARVLQNNANSASSPNLPRRISTAKSGMGSEDSAMASPFFRADDAKSSTSSYDAPERPTLGPKAASFFYVGSGNITASPDPMRSNSSGSPRPDASKFLHTNDLPEPSPRTQAVRPTLQKKKSTASIGSPRLQSPDLQRKSNSPSRPASPLKETSYRSAPPTLSSPPKSRPTATPVLTARLDAARRTSIGSNVSTPRQTLHKKSSSTNMVPNASVFKTPASPTPRQTTLPESQMPSKPPQRQRLSRDMTMSESSFPQPTSITSNFTISNPTNTIPTPTSIIPPLSPSPITSPIPSPSPAKPAPAPAQEAATNARRERKVLDLEISNSSLLAINRTLEREMRKQTTELRRFRRLSRSGRLSIRTVSGQEKGGGLGVLVEDGEDDARAMLEGLERIDLGESGEDDEDSGTDDDMDSNSNSNLSPTASGSGGSNVSSTHALAQRKRDEKRLMLDLSKHRQLLIDSEKMNSSIRRCLAWSEEMIKEGRGALEYRVKIGDVRLGGRVLEIDSEDDEGSDDGGRKRGMGLVSPSRVIGTMEAERLWGDARRGAEREKEVEGMCPIESTGFNAIHAGGLSAELGVYDDL